MRTLTRLLVSTALAVALPLGASAAAPVAVAATTQSPVTLTALQANAATNPVGIPVAAPHLGWQLRSSSRGASQKAYEVRVASSPTRLSSPDVWDSGRVTSSQSVGVPYAGPSLAGRTAYAWQVRVWDDQDQPTAWSAPASFETAMASTADWSAASWVGADSALPTAWTNSAITFHASKISGALGVYFRGRDSNNAYMWQLSQAENALRPHVKVNGGYSVLAATAFPPGFDWAAEHTYSIAVDGSTITTSVDGTVVDTRTDATFSAAGLVGFRTSGSETGTVSDVSVVAKGGQTLLDTTFPNGDRTFTGGSVTGGALLVSGNTDSWYAFGADVPVLRKSFSLDKPVASARVYASARGLYQLRLNGKVVGDEQLAPGVTDYNTRIQYQTYDVTGLLGSGANVIGAELGRGWYAGNVAMFGPNIWGTDPSMIAELRVRYTDGTEQVVATDDTWKTAAGPTTSADILDGEAYDARRAAALGNWGDPGYDDSTWASAVVRPSATAKLVPQTDPPVRVTQTLSATALPSPAAGTHVYDLKQNMVGHVRISLAGSPGQTVRIRVAEVLNPDGSLYTANYRTAKATDYYTFATSGTETWEPKFTFHGFRYVEITGVDAAPPASAVTGVVVGTDNTQTDSLSTSSPLVNQLYSNIVWGQRGNFLSIPTDTPARDERMGWTGDINVFSNTAVYNMDSQAFLSKWLQDLRDSQGADGSYPSVSPVIPNRFDGGYGVAGWADAGVHVPYAVWTAYGDTKVITDNYASMKKYVDYLDATSTNHIRSVGGYLDWLNLGDDTPAAVVDTAFVAKSTREFATMARAIGQTAVADSYLQRYEAIKAAYDAAFVAADGTVQGDSQTAYILTIMNDLVPDGMTDKVSAQFVQTLERRDNHLSTGFLGVDGLLPALTRIGRSDIAYILLQNTDYPSWGYEIGKGATTVWERWNSIMPDGSFGPVEMNSFNHYAYGAVGEWMYRTMAGVSALEPGYHKVLIAPESGKGVSWVDYSLDTRYGTVASSWKLDAQGGMLLNVSIPANTTAEVRIPTTSRWAVTEGGRPAESVPGITFVKMLDGKAVYTIGSGTYSFGQDVTLGQLGDARDAANALRSAVAALTTAGKLTVTQSASLTDLSAQLVDKVGKAWAAYVAGDRPGAATFGQQGLKALQLIAAYLDDQVATNALDRAVADALAAAMAPGLSALTSASASLVGAQVAVNTPTAPVYPGGTARVSVALRNVGDKALTQVSATLTSSDGWTVAPVTTPASKVDPGATATATFEVTVPATATVGDHTLAVALAYRYGAAAVSLPLTGKLVISAPVVVKSVAVSPATAFPGDTPTVTATLANVTSTPRTGTVTVRGPAGWSTVTAPFSLAAGETGSKAVRVAVPYTVTAESVPLTASTGSSMAETGAAALTVAMTSTPAVVYDHADIGLATSEAAHHLTASEHSGTSVEAGLTRRYTHSSYPGGWFEFDLKVPAGKPFVLRAVETYDGPQRKTYDVLADGVTVQQRRYSRTTSGVGTVTYEFLVDNPAITGDGTVRIRFQDVDGDYDPSIADVWSLPAIAGVDSASDVLAGSTPSARTSLEATPDWSVQNLVDTVRESQTGGPKGYTSNPPDTAQTGVDQWVSFDLGTARTLDTVVLYPRTATGDDPSGDGTDGGHFPASFQIQAGDDGTTWRTVRDVSDLANPGMHPVTLQFPSTDARYLRILVTTLGRPTVAEGNLGFYRLQLAEVQAFDLPTLQ